VLVVGAVVSVPVALLVDGLPSGGAQWRAAALAALAGVCYFGGFLCLLRGLSIGDLGLVGALTSLSGAYAAVVFVAMGAPITAVLAVGLALCVFGGVLTSSEGRAKSTRGAGWALAAGILFAAVTILYGNAGALSWISQAAISRVVSFGIVLPAALLTGGMFVPKGLRLTAMSAGVLELCAIALLTFAVSLGPLTVAGVTTAQFGTFAVILGVVILRERPRAHQWVGIACTMLGVSLLSLVVS